ncbi:unnamed protein product [Rotaria sp. Silwood1]|nr:unnamed protein product [Rotaria sp. Silwood1]
MGMAIRTKQYLDVRFPILLWKQLIYEEVTIEDIEAIDILSFAIINAMEENIRKVKSLNECDDSGVNNIQCRIDRIRSTIKPMPDVTLKSIFGKVLSRKILNK